MKSTMKKFFLLIVISSIIVACSDENEPNQIRVAGDIVGQWKLIYLHQRSWDSFISDVSTKSIIYNFKSNGILDVGAETTLLNKGQYNYTFGEETLIIGGQSFETQVVTIEKQKWLYSFSDGQMRLSEFDNDGGTLTFVKQ
jgi:hypothetical protein